MVQLVRIGAMVEQRWSLKKSEDEEDRDEKEESKNSPRGSQEKFISLVWVCLYCVSKKIKKEK